MRPRTRGREIHRRWRYRAAMAAILLLTPLLGHSESRPGGLAEYAVKRPQGARGTVVVPDTFLRRWDALTVFFPRSTGPDGHDIPEDHPEAFVRMTPPHPGAWTWLDDRTLQFRPADPWPPLVTYRLEVEDESFRLDTLMEAPVETIPANNETDLVGVDSLTLTFEDPIDPEALARMIDIELRPLPGVDARDTRRLTREDFRVKALERADPTAPASYLVSLNTPVPEATRVLVSFRLARKDSGGAFSQFTFSTAARFHVQGLACGAERLPVGIGGARFAPSQALQCSSNGAAIRILFSAPVSTVDPLVARRFVRIDPPVDNLSVQTRDAELLVHGDFLPDRLYRVRLVQADIVDARGRALHVGGEVEAYLAFPGTSPFLKWGAAQGVVERFGPKMVPLEGVGHARADLRIYPIPPLDRSFWPFPDTPVVVDESLRPPGPGEEPPPFTDPRARVSPEALAGFIASLGAPPVSELVDLHPLGRGEHPRFGLDLAPYLEKVDGKNAPGTYLVGLRRLDAGTERAWIRIQVTDLALSTWEETTSIQFLVTSLSTGDPVRSAEITLEGARTNAAGEPEWAILGRMVTDRHGRSAFQAPGPERGARIARIVVRKGDDILVLDPARAPDGYRDGHWFESESPWLQWAFMDLDRRAETPRVLCHVFSERPVYRPDEPVHIKGYVRKRAGGRLSIVRPDASLQIEGPGNSEWEYGLYVTEAGSFYFLFDEAELPPGAYVGFVQVEDPSGPPRTCGRFSFQKEDYRIPRFEVRLHGPDQVPLDRPFQVSLTSTYYAGGPVAGRPIRWRVTQYPYTFEPPKLPGFRYSSDGRFSSIRRFESTPQLVREDATDAQGAARIHLDPTIEPTAQPRTYVVEATVTGEDDQTVTATRQVVALPPFVLGVRAPRFVPDGNRVTPEIIMMGYDGRIIPDRQVVVRLISRQWHSHLQTGDFTDGIARYITDVVDTQVSETLVITGREPVPVAIDIPRSGVYLVEVEARDALGRAQVVAVDFYAGGGEPVAWEKPEQRVFTVSPDKERYDPGDTAHLVLQSPFQEARAVVVVEAPEHNMYLEVPIKGGAATVDVPIEGRFAPRIPVHVVAMRGRVPAPPPSLQGLTDLGKPATVAATTWLEIAPRDNMLDVQLEYPERAQPGEILPITIRLADPDGHPLPGEVTLWLVDQAVLALGKEHRLDPIPDFVIPAPSRLIYRDTREFPFGFLPVAEAPGGGEGEQELLAGLDKVTVRRNFCPIPYYQPEIRVGPDGIATVRVKLTDDLTNFKIRAKAVSGDERFGVATGMVSVRLPVLVQPSLPRFVRPGDTFSAEALVRVVEGPAGEARARLDVEGVALEDRAARTLTLDRDAPVRVAYPVKVPVAVSEREVEAGPREVQFRLTVQRTADGAGDGFEVRLPLRDDRKPVVRRSIANLTQGRTLEVDALPDNIRTGSVRRQVFVSNRPVLVALADGLDFLLTYPYGCTEQKISRARAILATRAFRTALFLDAPESELDDAVTATIDAIGNAVDERGLVAYWQGGEGYVSLTAWAFDFLLAAEADGYSVDPDLRHTLKRALRRALRSDFTGLIDGAAAGERTMALLALARSGDLDPGYAAELARRATYLDQESRARVALAFALGGRGHESVARSLAAQLWDGLVITLHQGQEVYQGLQTGIDTYADMILPSEARTLALTTRAIARYQPENPRLSLLVNALVKLGENGGWGSTNANAAAMEALADLLHPPLAGQTQARITVQVGDLSQSLEVSPETPSAATILTEPGALQVRLQTQKPEDRIVARVTDRYVPGGDGAWVDADSRGFVVTRELLTVVPGGAPPVQHPLTGPGLTVRFDSGDVVEDHVQVVNPADRHHVAIIVPLAAGLEPLNPALATAPPEAKPSRPPTLEPTYLAMEDDQVGFYYETLPKGVYDLRFRTRAVVPGRFVQPSATAEMMYHTAVWGRSPAARIEVERPPE